MCRCPPQVMIQAHVLVSWVILGDLWSPLVRVLGSSFEGYGEMRYLF